MASRNNGRTPASSLMLEKQISSKMYIDDPKASIKPQARNPITQDDVHVPESTRLSKPAVMLYAQPKSQGIAMGAYAERSKKSDIFGVAEDNARATRKYIPHSYSETEVPTVSLKKSEWQPPSRNPITQDTITEYAPAVRTKCSESTAFSHLYESKPEEPRTRNNT